MHPRAPALAEDGPAMYEHRSHPPLPLGVFAGLYALYAGLVFLVTAGLLFAPMIHRLLHRFQWEQSDVNL
jgi:hypothetical protein